MPIDYSKYPSYWGKLSKHIRFVRANNHCEWCGAENYQPHPITGSKVVLTVAHLDHNITNNRFSNLKALCQKCHNGHDTTYRAANRRKSYQQRTGQLAMFEGES